MAQLILIWENGTVSVASCHLSVEEMEALLAAGRWPAGCNLGLPGSPDDWLRQRIGGTAVLLLPRKRSGSPGMEDQHTALSPRQAEVLGLLGQGLKAAEIARRMGISLRTVHYHTAQLRRRLGTPASARNLPILLERKGNSA